VGAVAADDIWFSHVNCEVRSNLGAEYIRAQAIHWHETIARAVETAVFKGDEDQVVLEHEHFKLEWPSEAPVTKRSHDVPPQQEGKNMHHICSEHVWVTKNHEGIT
jgi:hypothetical protein